MTSRAVVICGLVLWAGATLVLADRRWFVRRSLVLRLRPYSSLGVPTSSRGVLSLASIAELVAPVGELMGAWLVKIDPAADLERRLACIHAEFDAAAFRVRQVGWAVLGLVVGIAFMAVLAPPPLVGLLFLVALPVVGFLGPEEHLSRQARAWRRRLFLELPVVAEQLALLLSAGWSVGAGLARIADRGSGACARDLDRVCRRMGHGLAEVDALREWGEIVDVPSVDRFVAVLALHRQTADLGRLLAEEARSSRRAVHRELIESTERRAQQVWIPVTVATLVPGVVFLAVPFVDALRDFSG